MRSRRLALPGERPGRSVPPELAARRRLLREAVDAGTWGTGAPSSSDVIGGVRVLRFAPSGPTRGRVLHFHGGAFRLGCPEMSGPFAAALAARCGVEVLCPAYRLAPEYPFPAGLADAVAVLSDLRRRSDAPVILSGDSAGGGLAASLAAHAVAKSVSLSGLVLLSAWLDLTVTSPGYQANAATDPLFSRAAAQDAADLYLQGLSPQHPLASPLFGPVRGFPPTLISIGEGEVLAEDGRRFCRRLRAAGVPATLRAIAGMEHVAVTRGLELPGAAETLAGVADFIDGRL